MICISDCFECKHQRDKLLDGWIPCCDAFPDGIPRKKKNSFICLVSALITER